MWFYFFTTRFLESGIWFLYYCWWASTDILFWISKGINIDWWWFTAWKPVLRKMHPFNLSCGLKCPKFLYFWKVYIGYKLHFISTLWNVGLQFTQLISVKVPKIIFKNKFILNSYFYWTVEDQIICYRFYGQLWISPLPSPQPEKRAYIKE